VVNFGVGSFGNHGYGVGTGMDGQWTQILCSQDSAYGGWDGAGNAFHEPWTQGDGKIYINVPKLGLVVMKRK
jgi:1,4-alpha-glucan branching enzyme